MERYLEATSSRNLKTNYDEEGSKGSEIALADPNDSSLLAANLARMDLNYSGKLPEDELGLSMRATKSQSFSKDINSDNDDDYDDDIEDVVHNDDDDDGNSEDGYDEVTVADEEMPLSSRGLLKSGMHNNFSRMSLYDEETVVSTMPDHHHHQPSSRRLSLYDEYTVAEESYGEYEIPLSGDYDFPSADGSIDDVDDDDEGEDTAEEDSSLEETDDEVEEADDEAEETDDEVEETDDEVEEVTVMDSCGTGEDTDDDQGSSLAPFTPQGAAAESEESETEDDEIDDEHDEEEEGDGFTLSFHRSSGGGHSGRSSSRMSDITLEAWTKEMMENELSDHEDDPNWKVGEDGYCIKFKEGDFRSSIMTKNSPKRSPKSRVGRRLTSRGISTAGLPIQPLAIVSEGTTEQESGKKTKKTIVDVGGPKKELFDFWRKRTADMEKEIKRRSTP
eukprot:scaffold6966_cov112-Cylindrotheca_fusiformis.AAC.12